jgi:hypothetical protein
MVRQDRLSITRFSANCRQSSVNDRSPLHICAWLERLQNQSALANYWRQPYTRAAPTRMTARKYGDWAES